uniref:Trafficking protein particle complex subunit n=1 Tax=Ostreococcus mediterraneus TaxID=1486918 RepID=A0A6U0AXL5_9CHLO|mmetsp:Transcript_1593/g.5744  ORF Transcript_1593/g.5744 Transcript_1593/m.5744 type:complete len:140 (+) Transcript_1593:153-572(+)
MRLFTFYMFNANGECMYQREWSRERASADEETEHKTLFGLFFTLKDFAKQLDPLGGAEGPCNFYAFTTNNYKLHFFETATGLRLLLTTDESAGDLRAFMKHIYSNIYIEYIVKNAALEPMKPFASDAFTAALDAYTALL